MGIFFVEGTKCKMPLTHKCVLTAYWHLYHSKATGKAVKMIHILCQTRGADPSEIQNTVYFIIF